MNSSVTLTYTPTPSYTSIVDPVVQLSSVGSMRGASVTDGCNVPKEVMNQATFSALVDTLNQVFNHGGMRLAEKD